MIRKGCKRDIVIVEKGRAVENRSCPKAKTNKCMNCKPYCHITTAEPLTQEEMRAYLDTIEGVSLGSDAFFPFSDNIERAHKSGVKYVAEPGGSVRDDAVIDCCDKYGMVMAFTAAVMKFPMR